jgi:putative ABC transport system substrate-binding protein
MESIDFDLTIDAPDRLRVLGRQSAAALTLVIAAILAAPSFAAPRVLVYATDDTPRLRAALAGVREAVGAIPIEEVPVTDAGARLKAAASDTQEVALITLDPHAAVRAAREAPSLAAIDCFSPQAPNAQAVPVAISLEEQLAWLHRLLPGARYIGVLYDPELNAATVDGLAVALRRADLNPVLAPVTTPAMLPAALAHLSGATDALLAVPDTTVYTPQTAKALLLFSFRNKLPLIGPSESWVQAGALYALDWDYRELGAFCGRLALRQLIGDRAPMPSPPRPHVFANQRSAQRFGLHWDASTRQSLDRVVQ